MRHRPFVILSSLLVLGSSALRAADPPVLIADINRLPVESSGFPVSHAPNLGVPPEQPVDLEGVLYFTATDPAHGLELWRSNGTVAGTRRVSDLRPGPLGSNPQHLTPYQGRLYFVANDGVRGYEIWSTDGTAAGTRLLADTCPGACDIAGGGYTTLVVSGGRLFFLSDRGRAPLLWVTDGTRAGTVQVGQVGFFVASILAPLPDGKVLLSVVPTGLSGGGAELWVGDGIPHGLFPELTSSQGSLRNTRNQIPLPGAVLFWKDSTLWRTDGTSAGTQILREGLPSPSTPARVVNGIAYFSSGAEIWETDGTAAGTVKLANGHSSATFAASPCGVLFRASDLGNEQQIWRIREPQRQVEPVTTVLPGAVGPWSAGDRVFYATGVDFHPETTELWTVDANTCQPRRVTELCGASRACTPENLFPVLPAGAGRIGFFGLNTAAEKSEIWRTDGTAAGTFRLRDIGFDPGSGAGPIAQLGGQALFSARPGVRPAGLWRTDGTAAGTRAVKFVPWPQGFIAAAGFLYFTSYPSGGAPGVCDHSLAPCQGLWRTDGTPAGTRQLATNAFFVQGLATGGGRLLFAATGDPGFIQGTGIEPWLSDGTAAGTRQIADLNQQLYPSYSGGPDTVGSSDPRPGAWTGSRFVFAADDGIHGREPWSVPASGGPPSLLNIKAEESVPQLSGSDPDSFIRLRSTVLFAADDAIHGRELWVSDGTAPGTQLVRDIRPGADTSSPHDLVRLNGKVYFLADDGGGEALWSSDGTAAGTIAVAPLAYQGSASRSWELTVAGNRLFFVVDNDLLGAELWTSDGTAAGTGPARDIRPGSASSYPQSLTAIDGLLVFAADDGATGLEPWVSDGTPGGTRQLGDLAPGLDASSPGPFVVAGSRVVFDAWDPVHGRELWAIPRAGLK
jgi:ELWxxDGT repeat protein